MCTSIATNVTIVNMITPRAVDANPQGDDQRRPGRGLVDERVGHAVEAAAEGDPAEPTGVGQGAGRLLVMGRRLVALVLDLGRLRPR